LNVVEFPGLGLKFNINRIAIPIGDGGIYWYGVIIAIGVMLGSWFSLRRAKKIGDNPDELVDFIIYAVPIGIIGARLYYVIFSFDSYKNNILGIFKVWEGGLAIYGGIIAGFITLYFFTKKRKINIYRFLDTCSYGVIIGQIIGRWGNFFNMEAYGSETNLPWRMVIPFESHPVHPTFLYESLANLLVFLIMLYLGKKALPYGYIFATYLTGYGTARFFIEGLRTDSLYLFNIRISQIVAALCVVFGIFLFFFLKGKKNVEISQTTIGEKIENIEENGNKDK